MSESDPFSMSSPEEILFQRGNTPPDPFSFADNDPSELFKHAREFELLVALVMKRLGYEVLDLAGKGDCGADLIATKDSVRRCVQIKCSVNSVRVSAVRQASFAIHAYNADGAILVTNSKFTSGARRVARDKGVKMVDGIDLRRIMEDSELLELRRIEKVAQENAWRIARQR